MATVQKLIALGGLPFTGKTVLGDRLCNHYQLPFLAVDRFRPLLYRRSISYADNPAGDAQQLVRAYAAVRATADTLLGMGDSVILEGTLSKKIYQEDNLGFLLKKHPSVQLRLIICWIPDGKDELVKARVLARKNSDCPSGATEFSDYLRVKERFEPIIYSHLLLDTTQAIEDCVRQCLEYIGNK